MDGARELGQEASRLMEETGFLRGAGDRRRPVAEIARADGDNEAAAELLARSAELAAGSEFTWWHGMALLALAELELERGAGGEGRAARARCAGAPCPGR